MLTNESLLGVTFSTRNSFHCYIIGVCLLFHIMGDIVFLKLGDVEVFAHSRLHECLVLNLIRMDHCRCVGYVGVNEVRVKWYFNPCLTALCLLNL